jgi:hypothetical protein
VNRADWERESCYFPRTSGIFFACWLVLFNDGGTRRSLREGQTFCVIQNVVDLVVTSGASGKFFLRSWQSRSQSRNSPPFKKNVGSLPYSKEPTIGRLRDTLYHSITSCFRFFFFFFFFTVRSRKTLAQSLQLKDHPCLAVLICLFIIFASTLQIWRPSPPSATGGHARLWCQGNTVSFKVFRSNVCINFSPEPCVLRASPIPSSRYFIHSSQRSVPKQPQYFRLLNAATVRHWTTARGIRNHELRVVGLTPFWNLIVLHLHLCHAPEMATDVYPGSRLSTILGDCR